MVNNTLYAIDIFRYQFIYKGFINEELEREPEEINGKENKRKVCAD